MKLGDTNGTGTSRSQAAQARFVGPLLLTAFLGAGTVPALLFWFQQAREREFRGLQGELDLQLRSGTTERRETLPTRVLDEREAPTQFQLPERSSLHFRSELAFSAAQIESFRAKRSREGEFERALNPPTSLAATVRSGAIELSWEPPVDLDQVRDRLQGQPLLRLGFRVYRWREGDEPKLLTTFEGGKTAFQDRDLPLWRERFFYCVATVLEGTIGELPTLIESKRSSVITADTLEQFTLRVLDGEADHVRCALEASLDGRRHELTFDVAVGHPIVPPPAADLDAEEAVRLDTGLTVESARWIDGTLSVLRQRPEFLPDGRRKLDPASGAPTFRSESGSVPTRTLEVTCRDRSGATRTFTSAAPN